MHSAIFVSRQAARYSAVRLDFSGQIFDLPLRLEVQHHQPRASTLGNPDVHWPATYRSSSQNVEIIAHPKIVSAHFTGPSARQLLTTREQGDLWDDNGGDAAVRRLDVLGAPHRREVWFTRRPNRAWSIAPELLEDQLAGPLEYQPGLRPDAAPIDEAEQVLFVRLRVPDGTRANVQMCERAPVQLSHHYRLDRGEVASSSKRIRG
jgi:hypothetical protein